MSKEGLVYAFTGEGKGKTSAALGTAVRELLNDGVVVWVSWYKEWRWQMSEMALEKLWLRSERGQLSMYWMGRGFYFKDKGVGVPIEMRKVNTGRVYDRDTPEGHKQSAIEALAVCKQVLSNEIPVGVTATLLIMDEVINAIGDGLVDEQEVLDLLESRGSCHIILTGRGISERLVEACDLVSEMKKIKHPYDRGKLAIKGLDF